MEAIQMETLINQSVLNRKMELSVAMSEIRTMGFARSPFGNFAAVNRRMTAEG